MNVCLRIAFASICLLFVSKIPAQVGVFLPVLNEVAPGEIVLMPVQVTNFDSIASAQFVIRWDIAVLKFKNINGFGLPGLSGGDFSWTNALDSGILRFAWEADNSFPGVSVADSSTIFRVRFDVIGAALTGSPVNVTEAFPTYFEFSKVNADSSLTAITLEDAIIQQGFVAVGYTLSTYTPGAGDLPAKIFPNPFSETARIEFSLAEPADVQLLITDTAGRLIFEKNIPSRAPGLQATEIDRSQFHNKGAYFMTLRTATQSCVRPFFLL